MNIKDIKGTTFKKLMKAEKSAFRWHNKNKSGGNFGLEIRGIEGINYELSGDYCIDGSLWNLRFGLVYQAGFRFNATKFEKIEDLCSYLLEIISNSRRNSEVKFHEMKEVA